MHPDSERLALYICEQSKDAQVGGELFDSATLIKTLEMSEADLGMAMNELVEEGLIHMRASSIGNEIVMAEAELFRRFDPIVKGWTPEEDALVVAREIVRKEGGAQTSEIAKTLGWAPRRMNPACEELYSQGKVNARKFLGTSPFTYGHLIPTDATRRLARDGW